MAAYLHLFTAYWHARPFGVTMLIAGYDNETKVHELYMAETTGEVFVSASLACGRGVGTVIVVCVISPCRGITAALRGKERDLQRQKLRN